jgi:hypothetical protein
VTESRWLPEQVTVDGTAHPRPPGPTLVHLDLPDVEEIHYEIDDEDGPGMNEPATLTLTSPAGRTITLTENLPIPVPGTWLGTARSSGPAHDRPHRSFSRLPDRDRCPSGTCAVPNRKPRDGLAAGAGAPRCPPRAQPAPRPPFRTADRKPVQPPEEKASAGPPGFLLSRTGTTPRDAAAGETSTHSPPDEEL